MPDDNATLKELDRKLAIKMLKQIAYQLAGIELEELSTAERNIFFIMKGDFLTVKDGVVEEI